MSTLRLGGHYLAMVTISFQTIVTLVMINAIGLHPWPGRGLQHRPARSVSDRAGPYLASLRRGAVRRRLCWSGICRTRSSGARCGGARQRARRRRQRHRRVPHQGLRVHAVRRCSAVLPAGLFAGGFTYVSPDQFRFAESVVFLTMVAARRRLPRRLGSRSARGC